ncbi:MAG: hypothetical protein ABTD50_23805, partial [Polyangiaceae bacterium]
MRKRSIVGGLRVGIAAVLVGLLASCGTDTSGTCADTICPTDGSVADASGGDAPQDALSAEAESGADAGNDGAADADATVPPDAVAEASADASADAVAEASGDADAGADSGPDAGPDAAEAGCEAGLEPWQETCVIDDAYGVFVAMDGSDSEPGTMAHPVQTITKGIALAAANDAGAKRVYVCAG